ncbi:MAG: hypothetical protein ACYSYL_17805 [Planctomycetota bacterium]|jgi:hypothetical protein
MSDKKEKKLSYALTEANARKQLESAKGYNTKAKSLLKLVPRTSDRNIG